MANYSEFFYNIERKERFIQFRLVQGVTLPPDYLPNMFKLSGSTEKELEKDICEFTVNEIKNYYKKLNRTSEQSLAVMNSMLSVYTEWCIKQRLVRDNQNHFDEMTLEQFSECVNKLYKDKSIITRESLLKLIEQLDNPCDQFIFLALFEGIKGDNNKDLWSLHLSDFHDNLVTLQSGRKVIVSNKLVEIARECAEATVYYSVKAEPNEFKFAESDDTIIKNYVNVKSDVDEFQKGKRIYNKFIRCANFLGIKFMRMNSIINSGKVAFVNERATDAGMSAFDWMTVSNLKQLDEQYGDHTVRNVFYRRNKDYLV